MATTVYSINPTDNNKIFKLSKLDELPDNPLIHLFENLPVPDLISTARVCKRFNFIISNGLLKEKIEKHRLERDIEVYINDTAFNFNKSSF